MDASARSVATRPFGRMVLHALLGKGIGSTCWLAVDTADRQERLLVVPRHQPHDATALADWQRAVNRAARLRHPAIAPVSEIGVQDRWPYVSIDRLQGETLAERLQRDRRGPTPMQAVEWICAVLEALAYAHESGVVHGDVQAHHVLIDSTGTVRLGGFEVAGAAPGAADDRRRGDGAVAVDPTQLRQHREASARDLLMCGVLLHRLLGGSSPLDEADAALVVQRLPPVGRDLVRLPWSTPHPVPEALRAIVNRSTDRQPAHRYFTARSLLRALQGWAEAAARDDGGALGLMLDRLEAVGHLPARADVQGRVMRATTLDRQHSREIAGDLLLDMGLSFELLRQVNTVSARSAMRDADEPVLTLRRAIALVGLRGVQRAAGALRPWPGPLDSRQARALEQAMDQARVAAGTAVRLRPAGYDGEVVYLIALMQNLGRLLVHYHFPDEAAQIRDLMRSTPATADQPAAEGMTEREASYAVLGIDTEAIGLAVAKHWGLTDDVLHMIRRIPADKAVHAGTDGDLLRAAGSVGNDAVDALLAGDPTRVGRALGRVVQRYARVLSFTSRDVQDALHASRQAVRSGRVDVDSPLTSMASGPESGPGDLR